MEVKVINGRMWADLLEERLTCERGNKAAGFIQHGEFLDCWEELLATSQGELCCMEFSWSIAHSFVT